MKKKRSKRLLDPVQNKKRVADAEAKDWDMEAEKQLYQEEADEKEKIRLETLWQEADRLAEQLVPREPGEDEESWYYRVAKDVRRIENLSQTEFENLSGSKRVACLKQTLQTSKKYKAPPSVPINALTDHPLEVDLVRKILIFEGEEFPVDSENALRWVKILAEHPGEVVSSSDLVKRDHLLQTNHTKRLLKYLPSTVSNLISSKTGSGSYIRLRF